MWECLTAAQSSRAVSNPSRGEGVGVALTFCFSNTLYLHSGSKLIVCLWSHPSCCLLLGLILPEWNISVLGKGDMSLMVISSSVRKKIK